MGTISSIDNRIKTDFWDRVYDTIVLLYICAMFVLENDTYDDIYSVIQYMFVGFSMLELFLRGKIALMPGYFWSVGLLAMAMLIYFFNQNTETTATINILLRNVIKVCLTTFYIQKHYKRNGTKILQAILLGGILCGCFLLSEFVEVSLTYDDLKYATNSRIGASIAGGNVNIVAMNMVFAFMAAMFFFENCEKKWLRRILLVCVVFIAGTSLLTGSRKIVLIYLIVLFLRFWAKGAKGMVLFCIIAVTVYTALMTIEPLYFLVGHRIDFFSADEHYLMYEESDEGRLKLAMLGLNAFLENPLGIGFGNSTNYIGNYAHNNAVEVLMSGGLVGFLMYYGGYWYALSFAFINKDKNVYAKFVASSIIALMALEIFQVTYLYSIPMVFIALMLSVKQLTYEDKTHSMA